MWINFDENIVPDLATKLEAAGFGDLAVKLREELENVTSDNTKELIKLAIEQYEDSDCDLEVDEHAFTSESDNGGTWVMAWVFARPKGYDKAVADSLGGDDDEEEDDDDEEENGNPFDPQSPEGRRWLLEHR
jgi:hypothetical protein